MDHIRKQKPHVLEEQIQIFYQVLSCIHSCDRLLLALESFGIPHIYIPGNHDPVETYSPSVPSILPEIAKPSTNLHNHCVKLADHLWLAGFGGSIPRMNEDGSINKSGYPYIYEDMKQEITELISLIPKHDQVILMTHNPPAHVGSSTVDQDYSSGKVYLLGSQSMYDQIAVLMKDVFIDVIV